MNNWKTTLAGFGAGALNMFANGTGWKQILLTIGFAALGAVSRDYNNPIPPTPGANPSVLGIGNAQK